MVIDGNSLYFDAIYVTSIVPPLSFRLFQLNSWNRSIFGDHGTTKWNVKRLRVSSRIADSWKVKTDFSRF